MRSSVARTADRGNHHDGAAAGGGGGWMKALIVMLLIIALLVGVGFYVVHKITGLSIFTSSGCTASSGTASVSLDLGQTQNAATIAAVGLRLGVPPYGIEIAEATAMQESKLRNLDYGDRDSLGLFQQRTSEGWGTAGQIMDPVYSSTRFYDALLKVPGWQNLALTDAAQDVQHSGAPAAYAQHESDATVLSAVFTGAARDGLGCTLDGPTFAAQTVGPGGLTEQGAALRTAFNQAFGSDRVVDVARDGLSFGLRPSSTLAGTAAAQRGWAYANWTVAQAQELGVAQVGYDGEVWSAAHGSDGWQKAAGSTQAPTDEVSVEMTSGS
jgi:hypothetical protein